MSEPITISAKNLGALAMPNFCPRCFWIGMHVDELPYQVFPGIFSSIDSYNKKLVHGWFDRHGSAPAWLSPLGNIKTYRPPPHYSKFKIFDAESNVTLWGNPDGILVMEDNSHLIVDYKTAKFTPHQDSLFPMYEVQLNAYAMIGEQKGFAPVSGLALVYTEPVTDPEAAAQDSNQSEVGFRMEFSARFERVELQPARIPSLLAQVREISDRERPPRAQKGCKNCALLQDLLAVAGE